jgi:hypothetical protein
MPPRVRRAPTAMFSKRADITTFTDRDEEFHTLLDAVLAAFPRPSRDRGDGGVRAIAIHTVDGMPGAGKTTLTVHAAHHLAAQFPDGDLFLDLRGMASNRWTLARLESLLTSAGVDPKMIPTPLEDRARLWRDRISRRRTRKASR